MDFSSLKPLERRVLDEALSQFIAHPIGSVKRSIACQLIVDLHGGEQPAVEPEEESDRSEEIVFL